MYQSVQIGFTTCALQCQNEMSRLLIASIVGIYGHKIHGLCLILIYFIELREVVFITACIMHRIMFPFRSKKIRWVIMEFFRNIPILIKYLIDTCGFILCCLCESKISIYEIWLPNIIYAICKYRHTFHPRFLSCRLVMSICWLVGRWFMLGHTDCNTVPARWM